MAPGSLILGRTFAADRPPDSSSSSTQLYPSILDDVQKSIASFALSDSSNPRQETSQTVKLPENEDKPKTWSFLPIDIKCFTQAKLDYLDLYRAKTQSKEFKDLIESKEFHDWRGKACEGLLTTLYFFVRDGIWNCEGYDLITKSWKRIPPFTTLPYLDPDSFKDHSICTAGCLICVNVGKAQERLIVFNPLTGHGHKELPHLVNRRNPVLMHMIVDPKEGYYKIIIAGSSRLGDEHLSKTTEVYDSRTTTWKVTEDLPGPVFALNEPQTGVLTNGILYCIAFLEDDRGKGLLAYNVDQEQWVSDLTRPLPYSTSSNIVQLLESNVEVYLFSEVEQERCIQHRIDLLDRAQGQWRSVMTEMKAGNQRLRTYPEFIYCKLDEGKLHRHTIEHHEVTALEAPSVNIVSPAEGKFGWDHLPHEVQGRILGHLTYEQIFQLKTVSRNMKEFVEAEESKAITMEEEPTLTACYFYNQNGALHWGGFDPYSKKWRQLPPLTFLPASCKLRLDFFKEYRVCANDGLVCINFPISVDEEKLIVVNPMTKNWRELPPLNHRRNPVLMHMLVDPVTKSYQVIVAGSSKSDDKDLSRITEVFDSRTSIWARTGDFLRLPYAVNEFESGVYQDGKLFCIGFVEENGQVGKGIIVYDVDEGKWMHALLFSTSSTILQLVENSGEVFLFSERVQDGHCKEHWIDRLEWTPDEKNKCELINVVKKEVEINGWSLEIYGPEYTCIPYSDSQLYIFSAYDHTGVVHDIRDQGHPEVLHPLPREYTTNREQMFNSLYPILFTVNPRFCIDV